MKPEVKADKNKRVVSTAFIASAQISRLNKMVMSEADVMKEEIKEIPDSKLYIRYRGNLVLFTERRKGKIYGITRERDLVYALARRQYLELHMEMLEQIIEEGWTAETEQIINDYYPQIEALLKRFEDAGLDIGIITMTPDQRIWNADRHSKSAFRREDLKYPTSKGRVYMRSKSEQLIGDLLEELYIPYRYEPEVTINNRTYHPDFVIMLAQLNLWDRMRAAPVWLLVRRCRSCRRSCRSSI